jgi:hypothetical protein
VYSAVFLVVIQLELQSIVLGLLLKVDMRDSDVALILSCFNERVLLENERISEPVYSFMNNERNLNVELAHSDGVSSIFKPR